MLDIGRGSISLNPLLVDQPPQTRYRVLIVDDHEIVAVGLRALLSPLPWVERCLDARGNDEAVELTRRHEPQVAIVDMFVGHESGIDICSAIKATHPSTAVALFSGAERISTTVARAVQASGFISKSWTSAQIASAISEIACGDTVFDAAHAATPPALLTIRECDVLVKVAHGATNPEAAAALHLAQDTVKQHLSSAYRKLRVKNRADAVRRFQALGYLDEAAALDRRSVA